MCVVSMIGDHYRDKFTNPQQWPGVQPYTQPDQPFKTFLTPPAISREEFESLKMEVAEMRELLRRAKMYDEANGEPACEIEEKVAVLRRVAELVGVSLDDLLPR
jgi:hypothetical protein